MDSTVTKQGAFSSRRLLPVIRHVISIPAGIIRMNFATFSVMTLAGSALWCSVLRGLAKRATREHDRVERCDGFDQSRKGER